MSEDIVITKTIIIPSSEIQFRYSRSSGPGGQNVNKLSTKAELMFNVEQSHAFDEAARGRLRAKLASHIDGMGFITITAQESRSQYQNKRIALDKFILLLRRGLFVAKPRKSTKPTRTSTKNGSTVKINEESSRRPEQRRSKSNEVGRARTEVNYPAASSGAS